ncbi:hypothetical protein GQ44DRAFT_831937 [Phaeosphaeriaceae sp. PMI808]|nr:hypothetical protein GQ44DRAFT_831937 [Phaeosphaeriaceae sp. PMI808]
MASSSSVSPDHSGAKTLLTPDEVAQVLSIEVLDREGKAAPLGDLAKGKRTVLIFTRHFWCTNCQLYVKAIAEAVPRSSLPSDTQVLVIGNGGYQPIDAYAAGSSSMYPIYTDPTCRLHEILKFNYSFKEGSSGDEKRDYMRDAGGTLSRTWTAIKGAVQNLQHTNYIGPKSLNGGEVVLSADGKCEYIYRMQNTVDHTSISDLAKIIRGNYLATA